MYDQVLLHEDWVLPSLMASYFVRQQLFENKGFFITVYSGRSEYILSNIINALQARATVRFIEATKLSYVFVIRYLYIVF